MARRFGFNARSVSKALRDPEKHGPPIDHFPHPKPITTAKPGFPHMWKWPNYSGSGGPILTAPGVFDTTHVAAAAKCNMVAINSVPFTNPGTPANLGIIAAMKAYNPSLIFSWLEFYQWKFAYTGPNLWGDVWSLMVGPPDVRFYMAGSGGTVFWPDNAGNFYDIADVQAALLALYRSHMVGNGADGILFDTFIANAGAWYDPPGIDLALAGYATLADLNSANAAATSTIITGLQDAGKLWANRGAAPGYTPDSIMGLMTGEMIESWDPDWGQGGTQIPQGGVSNGLFANFDAAMTQLMSRQGTDPTGDGGNLIKQETGDNLGDPSILGTAAWNKSVRYGLGCACVAGGMLNLGYGNARNNVNDVFSNADEYAVDATGHTDLTMSAANRGWLGRPVAFGFKDAGGCYVRRFQNGIVIVNGPGATRSFTLDATYKRIAGAYDTTVNSGAFVSGTISVPSKDGRFLLRAS